MRKADIATGNFVPQVKDKIFLDTPDILTC